MQIENSLRWIAPMGAAALALGAAPRALATPSDSEIVVLYDDARVSLSELDGDVAACAATRRFGAAHSRRVRSGGTGRLSAATWRVPSGDTESRVVAALAATSGVAYAGRNRHWSVRGAPRDIPLLDPDRTASEVAAQAAMDQIDVPEGTISNVQVAVLDGGFDLRHEYLAGHIASGGWDTLDDDADAQDLGDDVDGDGDGIVDDMVGHGTFVAGLVLAVAPGSQVIPYRVLDDEGQGNDLAVWLAVSRALDAGADVVNLSMVLPTMPPPLLAAIDTARSDGVVFVTAAGNDPNGPFDDPALVARAVVVGGVDGDDDVLSWSPSGSHVEVFAPSESLLGPLGGDVEDSYGTWSGTSFGCALVSGAAARVRAENGTLTPSAVESILTTNVDPVTGEAPTGRLDVAAAVAAAK